MAIRSITRKNLSSSYLVKNDAKPLSVARSFYKNEWIELLQQAGIKNYSNVRIGNGLFAICGIIFERHKLIMISV